LVDSGAIRVLARFLLFCLIMIEILLWIGGWLLIICGVAWAIGMATGTPPTSDD